jgi:hypothetical protein
MWLNLRTLWRAVFEGREAIVAKTPQSGEGEEVPSYLRTCGLSIYPFKEPALTICDAK